MLRSEKADHPAEMISVGGLQIDPSGRTAQIDGRPLSLRPREFDLLAYLAGRPGRVFTRDQLLQEVWGFDYAGDTRTVDVHVRWLRMKIEEDAANPTRLQTVRGVGYRYSASTPL
jgi:DNA-binding response OmpR family regulator